MNVILEAKVPFSWVVCSFLLFSKLQLFSWLCRPLPPYKCPHFFYNCITFFFHFCVCVWIYQYTKKYTNDNWCFYTITLRSYKRFSILYTLGRECICSSGIAVSSDMSISPSLRFYQLPFKSVAPVILPLAVSVVSISLLFWYYPTFHFLPKGWYLIVLIFIFMISNYLFMCSLDIWVLYRIYWPFKELIYHSSKCRYAHSDVQPSRKHLSNTCYLLDTMLDGGETKMIKFSPCPWAAHILGTGAIRDVFLCNYYIPSDRSKPRLW